MHGTERRSVAVRRASVIVGTRESDVIGDGDEDSSGGGKGVEQRARACIYREREREGEWEEKEERRCGGDRWSERRWKRKRRKGGGVRGGSTALVRLSSRGDCDSRTETARGSRVPPG